MSETQARPVRIAVVDDDPVLRAHLVETIEAAPDFAVAGAADTLAAGLALLDGEPDVMLVDLGLPDGSGLDLIRAARARGLEARIVVVSVFGDVRNVIQAIEAGADGYVLKGDPAGRIADAIRSVLEGGAPISAAVAGHLLARVRGPAAAPTTLTASEIEVLGDLSKGFSYREVAGLRGVSYYTVADQVKSIYRKLRVNSKSEAVFEAVQAGLIRMRE